MEIQGKVINLPKITHESMEEPGPQPIYLLSHVPFLLHSRQHALGELIFH